MDAFTEMKREAARLLADACKSSGHSVAAEDIFSTLETPKEEFGDLASPVAFDLAKKARKPPRKIAEEIARSFPGSALFSQAEVAGAGYINLYFNPGEFAKKVLPAIAKDYGRNETGAGRRAIVEFPSVNPNKPWHIGHLRNALLGDSVARILEFSGYEVQRIDYIDDLGLQVAQSVWYYEKMKGGAGKAAGEKFDHFVGAQYVEAAKEFEANPKAAE
jgi:arginyl-tRNA synthetase